MTALTASRISCQLRSTHPAEAARRYMHRSACIVMHHSAAEVLLRRASACASTTASLTAALLPRRSVDLQQTLLLCLSIAIHFSVNKLPRRSGMAGMAG